MWRSNYLLQGSLQVFWQHDRAALELAQLISSLQPGWLQMLMSSSMLLLLLQLKMVLLAKRLFVGVILFE
jgi:hypothetical protein